MEECGTTNLTAAGSSPAWGAKKGNASIAQLDEQVGPNDKAEGSSPSRGTKPS